MAICLVTSVFNIRKSRPLNYYLLPAIHLLEDLANSDIKICLFTDQSEDIFPKAENIHIFKPSLESLLEGVWNNPAWKDEYRLRSKPGTEQHNIPELIAIWLGKISMMKIAADLGDIVLWQDSGIRMAKIFNKNHIKYKKHIVFPDIYNKFIQKLHQHSMVFTRCDKYEKIYHGIEMNKYSKNKTLVRAGFIMIKSSELEKFQLKIKEKWDVLIKNGDYGTEENALTLYQWENNATVLSCDQWLKGLGLQ